jgi:anti-sigma factor RsiW
MSKWIKPMRTAIQSVIALIPAVPFLVPVLGLSATAGLGASLVTVASLASAAMQTPAVEKLLSTLGLASNGPTPSDEPASE